MITAAPDTLRRLADRRIEDAMKEGKFDNLPGKGKPLNLEPMPAEENARLTWWALRILKNNDYTPDEIRSRLHQRLAESDGEGYQSRSGSASGSTANNR